MTNRKAYIDIAKGITIILVILGHCLGDNNYIKQCIYTFHMPLFFIVSGYFYKKENKKTVIKKGLKRLVKPYCITILCIVTANLLYAIIKNENIIDIIKNWFVAGLYGSGEINTFLGKNIKIVGAIWFLLSLFWIKILYSFIDIKDKKLKTLIMLSVSFLGFALPKFIWLPLSIETSFIGIMFFHTGIYFRKKDFFERKLSYSNWAILLAIFIISGFVIKTNCVSNYYNYYYLNIVVGCINSFFIVMICKYIENTKYLNNVFSWLGRNSLYILCFHCAEGRGIIPWNYLIKNNSVIIKIIRRMFFAIAGTKIFELIVRKKEKKKCTIT